jgi:hypothetical protein
VNLAQWATVFFWAVALAVILIVLTDKKDLP